MILSVSPDKNARQGRYYMFVAAVLYVFSQTALLLELKDLVTAAALLLFLLAVTGELTANRQARVFLQRPSFLLSGSLVIIFAAMVVDSDNLAVIPKLIILLLATPLFMSAEGLKTIESYADGALLSVMLIAVLAISQLIPSAQFSAHDLWVKESGGFSNPNNGPYFIYISSLIYFINARLKKAFLSIASLMLLFSFDIFSRTYFAVTILLFAATLCDVRFSRHLKYAHLFIGLIALIVMLAGIYFYLGVVLFPRNLQNLQGSPLDLITSLRISVALEDAAYSSNSIIGISVTRLDSLYVEMIYTCGPAFLLVFFWRFVRNLFQFKPNSIGARAQIAVSATLIAGLFEIQILNITPAGSLILLYGLTRILAIPKTHAATASKSKFANENLLLHKRAK